MGALPLIVVDDRIGQRTVDAELLLAILEAGDAATVAAALAALLGGDPQDTTFEDLILENTLTLGTGTKTAAAVAGAATLNKASGVITSEALTTAAGASYVLTLTNNLIDVDDVVVVSFDNGTNTQGTLELGLVTVADDEVTIEIRNTHASEALNGTIKISYALFK